MTPAELAVLAALALVDSTSVGTLLVPVWFLTVPGRVRAGRVLAFLATVAAFYLVVGLALAAGAHVLLERAGALAGTPVGSVLQLVVGAALLVGSFFIGRGRSGSGGGRVLRWRERAVTGDGGLRAVVVLALVAAGLELATMLPYLGAIGMLTQSDLGPLARTGVLAAYCLVMVLPALVLLGVRLAAHRLVAPALTRLGAWLERTGAETTAWVVGIVGFLVARDALGRLPALDAALGGWGGGLGG
ncbi:hypothetical protein GXB85_14215 [Cellulomonas sp. APG4]|uniref:GAP family protein n=1 Tax=Cellulomonas sp. APG4 TaxID=1538656 RepID=UPI00137A2470|nr:GAP family protein [Cellulomonas sp. APG4]NCT92098.1 hypothetical protein [Cellulomonas sp. APG4]